MSRYCKHSDWLWERISISDDEVMFKVYLMPVQLAMMQTQRELNLKTF